MATTNTTPNKNARAVAELLLEHENSTPYRTESIVEMEFAGHDVVAVSDLHMAEGAHPDGRYTGPENFFYDDAFARFLADAAASTNRPTVLAINGDVVDFLRIVEVPFDENGIPNMSQINEWSTLLATIGWNGNNAPQALIASVSNRQKKLGLGTSAPQSAWKLWLANRGHGVFFRSLAVWLDSGNQIVITKGNHDLEWYWPEVRNTLRLILANHLAAAKNISNAQALQQSVLGQLHFIDDALLIDGQLYMEHGHRYDRNARVIGEPVLPLKLAEPELNIPFGSFFNRYLLNRIERLHPFMDNIRPTQNVIPIILRERFWLGIKIIFWHIPLLFRLIRGKYYQAYGKALVNYLFRRLIWQIVAVFGPVILVSWLTYRDAPAGWWAQLWIQMKYWVGMSSQLTSDSVQVGDTIIRFFLSAYAAYLLGQMVSNIQLMGIDSMTDDDAVVKLRRKYPIVTMGHTHNPDQLIAPNGHAFFNTGTWIPIVQANSAELRVERTFTFLWCNRNAAGRLVANGLRCWNDDAKRSDQQTVLHRE